MYYIKISFTTNWDYFVNILKLFCISSLVKRYQAKNDIFGIGWPDKHAGKVHWYTSGTANVALK